MSRRRQAVKRPLAEDPKFGSALVSRLVNTVMGSGKKNTAQRIVYGAFDQLAIDAVWLRLASGIEVLARLEPYVREDLFGQDWTLMWGTLVVTPDVDAYLAAHPQVTPAGAPAGE